MSLVSVDRATGEVVRELPDNDLRMENLTLREELARLKESLDIQVEQVRQVNRRNQALLKERNEARALDPLKAACDRVWEKWKACLAPNAKEFGEKRYSVVRARLNGGYGVEDLLRAIDGALNMPTTITGSQRKQMQELEYICRNEKNVDMFLGWATDGSDGQSGPVTHIHSRRDPWLDYEAAFRVCPSTSPYESKWGWSGYCQACVYDGESSIATLTRDGKLRCDRGCSHERQVEFLLDWYAHSEQVRCPECFGRVTRDANGKTWRAAA